MSKETPETPVEKQELITINGKYFFKDSLGEDQVKAFEQAMGITKDIEIAEINVRNLNYARQYLVDYLEKNNADWKEFIPPATDETEAEAETEAK